MQISKMFGRAVRHKPNDQSPFHAMYYAKRLRSFQWGEDKLLPTFDVSANLEIHPHQVEAALFALRSSQMKGVILADETGLGKSVEALLVMAQKWYEGKQRILLLVPTHLLYQWTQEFEEKLLLPHVSIDNNSAFNDYLHDGQANPFEQEAIVITTYDFATEKAEYISDIAWDVTVYEEAHRLAAIKAIPSVPKAKIATVTVRLDIQKSGISHTQTGLRTDDIDEVNPRLLDVIRIISNECRIIRSDCYKILADSGRITEFFYNPQQFLEQVTEIIKEQKRDLEIAGIRYKKLEGKEYYEMEVFESEELTAFLGKNAVKVDNSIYDYVIYDSSTIEKPFAQALDEDKDVRMFFKLPPSFAINTPLGTYNPDWAVFLDKNDVEKMYFIIETKGSTNRLDLRYVEDRKIHCGIRHFESLDSGVEQHLAKNWTKFRLGN